MKKLSSCILIEWKKLIKSKLSIVTACSICLVPFIVGLFATMMKYPENFKNLGLISAKMEMMKITDWSSYLMTISQVISVGGLLIFGFTASWFFGREYSDKTMIDLLALPIRRDTIVLAFFACLGRGYLSPLAFIIFTIIFSQLGSALNFGKYIPWAIPALASGIAGKALLNFGSIVSLFGVSILGLVATMAWWRYADYD